MEELGAGANAALRGSPTLARPFNSRSPGPQKKRAEKLGEHSAKGDECGTAECTAETVRHPKEEGE